MAGSKNSASFDAGWGDFLNGMRGFGNGIGGGLAESSISRLVLAPERLRALYSSGGFASLLIDIIAEEMTRKQMVVKDDVEDKFPAYFEKWGINESRKNLIRWSRLFGGALGVLMVNDGSKQIWRPLREGSVQSFDGMRVFDRWRVQWYPQDLYTSGPKYGTPEVYTILPVAWAPGSTIFRVHETRCVRMDGEPVDDLTRVENLEWGDSFLTRCYRQLVSMLDGLDASSSILDNFITDVFSITGLMQKIMNGNLEQVKDRIRLMRYTKNLNLGVMLDAAGETYNKQASTVTGIPDVILAMVRALSAVSRIPGELLGVPRAGGLQVNGDSEWENHYNNVDSMQVSRLLPVDMRLVHVASLVPGGPSKGKPLNDPQITYPSLAQVDESEAADNRSVDAGVAKVLIDSKVVHPDEVRAGLVSTPAFSTIVKLDPKYDLLESRSPTPSPMEPSEPGETPGAVDPENPGSPGEPKGIKATKPAAPAAAPANPFKRRPKKGAKL